MLADTVDAMGMKRQVVTRLFVIHQAGEPGIMKEVVVAEEVLVEEADAGVVQAGKQPKRLSNMKQQQRLSET